MTATRRAATRLRLDWAEAGPTLPHSTLVHVQVTECSTATDTHAAGAQDGSQSALTAGPNPTHMDPTQHKHIIRTTVCAHERGSGISRDCRLKYNFNFEDMSVAFSDSPTFCDQYDTFFIQIHSVEAELQAREDW